MRDKKGAHKLRCVDASVDKKKQLIMGASVCGGAPGKDRERM